MAGLVSKLFLELFAINYLLLFKVVKNHYETVM